MKKGDEVFWTDPDDGIASGFYRITDFEGEMIALESDEGSFAWAMRHEIVPAEEKIKSAQEYLQKVFEDCQKWGSD